MDNLTHSLFAITLARTPLSRAGRGTTAVLLLASNAPDIDILATAGGAVNYLSWHRGYTHGPFGVVGLGVLAAAIVWMGRRMLDRRGSSPGASADARDPAPPDAHDAPFWMLVAVSMIGVLLHVLMDLPTSYGTRLLAPFSWRWFGADWMPIVDIYLLIALAVGLIFGQRSPAAQRRNAMIVLMLMAANYGLRAAAHHEALALVPRVFGPTLPQYCDPPSPTWWPIDAWPRAAAPSSPPPGRRCLVEAVALPSFTSPFRWRIIVQLSNAYEVRDIDLLDARLRGSDDTNAPWRLLTRYPNVWTPAIAQAATSHLGQVFLGFSRLPAARMVVDRATGVTTVRFIDMRFAAGPVTVDQPMSRATPFTAAIRIDAGGRIIQETLGR